MEVVVVEAGRQGGRRQPLAPRGDRLAHGRHPPVARTIGRPAVEVGAGGGERLLEPLPHHLRPHVGHAQGQQPVHVRDEVQLHPAVFRQGRHQRLHQVGAGQALSEGRATVGQQHPAARRVGGDRRQDPMGHPRRQQVVQAGFKRRARPRRLHPHHPGVRRHLQDRRPRLHVRLLHVAAPLDPGAGEPLVEPRHGAGTPLLARPHRCPVTGG
jgi:hypothetical protein